MLEVVQFDLVQNVLANASAALGRPAVTGLYFGLVWICYKIVMDLRSITTPEY